MTINTEKDLKEPAETFSTGSFFIRRHPDTGNTGTAATIRRNPYRVSTFI